MQHEAYDVDVIGERVVAQIVDGIVLFAIAVVLLFGGVGIASVGEEAGGASGVFAGVGLTVVVAAFLVGLAYNVGLEYYWNGRTVGKRAMGIRVVSADGGDAGVGQVFVRNVPAVINLGLFSVVAALVSIAVNDRNQRVFDVFANTVVVDEGTAGDDAEYASTPRANQSTQF